MEQRVLPLDLKEVGVPGDHPNRIEAFQFCDVEPRLLAQPEECTTHSFAAGIGLRVDDGLGDVGRNAQGASPWCRPLSQTSTDGRVRD